MNKEVNDGVGDVNNQALHIGRLKKSLAAIDDFLLVGNAWSPEFAAWKDRTVESILAVTSPNSDASTMFRSFAFWNLRTTAKSLISWHPSDQQRYETDLTRARRLLEDLIEELESHGGEGSEVAPNFWALIHPEIEAIARMRFNSRHYGDAVEAALKHVNNAVKARFVAAGRSEEDGASLMYAAFAPSNPVIRLDDLSNETGRNVQQGYMQIFAGVMIGVRNPQAHANVVIPEERATHLLFLASLLRFKLDEAR